MNALIILNFQCIIKKILSWKIDRKYTRYLHKYFIHLYKLYIFHFKQYEQCYNIILIFMCIFLHMIYMLIFFIISIFHYIFRIHVAVQCYCSCNKQILFSYFFVIYVTPFFYRMPLFFLFKPPIFIEHVDNQLLFITLIVNLIKQPSIKVIEIITIKLSIPHFGRKTATLSSVPFPFPGNIQQ